MPVITRKGKRCEITECCGNGMGIFDVGETEVSNIGAFCIGIDTELTPSRIRIAFNPEESENQVQEGEIGLYTTMSVRVDGFPVPAAVFPELTYMKNCQEIYNLSHTWPVMCQPVYLKNNAIGSDIPPFYAFNFLAKIPEMKKDDFYMFQNPLGTFTQWPYHREDYSRIATSVIPLGMEFMGPFEDELVSLLNEEGRVPFGELSILEAPIQNNQEFMNCVLTNPELASVQFDSVQSYDHMLLFKYLDMEGIPSFICAKLTEDKVQLYEVVVKSREKELCRKRFDAEEIQFPMCLMQVSGDDEYEGELLTILDSETAACRIPNPLHILKTIQHNLEKTRTGNDYIVEEQSLSCEVPDAAEGILKLLRDGLKLNRLTLKCNDAPVLDEERLQLFLKGECGCRENIKSMQLIFTVSKDGELLLKIAASMRENWRFSNLFPEIFGKVFDQLKINSPWFCLDKENGFILGGTLVLRGGSEKVLELDWKCKVHNSGMEPTFELVPLKSFEELSQWNLSLWEAGRGFLDFHPVKLLVYNKCSDTAWEEKSAILCKADTGSGEALYEVSLPLVNEEKDGSVHEVTATLTKEENPFDLISNCVKEMGGAELASLLPNVLLLSGLDIRKYEIQTEGVYSPCSRRVLEASLPNFTLLPGVLSLKNTIFSLTSFCNEVGHEKIKRYYKASVKADIEVGTEVIKTELEIPDDDSWALILRPDSGYSVLAAAGTLLGLDKSSAFACLPGELFKVFDVSLKEFSVVFDPFHQELTYIRFDAQQCGEWELLPGIFTLYNWGVEVRIQQIKDGFQTSAMVKGSIHLGKGEHASTVNVNIPFGEDISEIHLRMKSGKVFLPTVQDIFEVCGLSDINESLPDGFAALGSPCMDDLEVVITKEKGVSVRSVYASFQTTESWALLPEPSSVLKNASARILYHAEKKKITGTIWGRVSIYDTEIDIQLTNVGKASEWKLSVSSFRPVHIPGIAQMEDWLMPGKFQACIPESLMPFPQGLDISRFAMKCNLSRKTVDSLGFTIENCGEWNVLPSLLTLKEVVLESDFQKLSSPEMKLEVQARVGLQLGGNKILVKLDIGNAYSGKDAVLTGSLERAYTEPVGLNEVIGTKTEAIASLPICSEFVIPVLESLKVVVNITRNQYIILADVEKLGQLGLAVVKEEDKWEYFVAFRLKKDFLFADIIPSLSVVDTMFRIEKAGMVLSSYESESLVTTIGMVKECQQLCPEEGLDGRKLKRGLMVYGQIAIKNSGFACILELGDRMNPELCINLSACFSEKSEETVFSGELSEFTILRLLKFRNIYLEYISGQGQSFQLRGEIALSVSGTEYAFSGAMDVNQERGTFLVSTLHEIDNPLGIPGISIKGLTLAVKCEFKTEQRQEKRTTVVLKGKAGLGKKDKTGTEPLVLEGSFLYDQEDFQIVQMVLSQPLSVEHLLESFLSETVWPGELLSITFRTGVLYYAKKECIIDQISYKKGIHLATEIDIYGFSFSVGVDVLGMVLLCQERRRNQSIFNLLHLRMQATVVVDQGYISVPQKGKKNWDFKEESPYLVNNFFQCRHFFTARRNQHLAEPFIMMGVWNCSVVEFHLPGVKRMVFSLQIGPCSGLQRLWIMLNCWRKPAA